MRRAALLLLLPLCSCASLPFAGRAGGVSPAASLLWTFRTEGVVDASPTLSGDGKTLYVSSWDHRLYALDAATGRLRWLFDLGDFADASPAANAEKVYAPAWNRRLACVDADSGVERWSRYAPPSLQDDHRQSSPALSGPLVLHGGFDGVLRGYLASTGHTAWELPTGGPIRSRPHPDGYVASGDGSLYAFDPATGRRRWTFPTGGALFASPVVAGGRVLFPSRDAFLYAVDAATGALLWKYDGGARVEYSSPALLSDTVVYGDCDGVVHGVDVATGRRRWTFRADGPVYAPAVAGAGRVAVADNGGTVRFLDPRTGIPVAAFRAGGAVQGLSSSPDGTVYAASRDHAVYALAAPRRPSEGDPP